MKRIGLHNVFLKLECLTTHKKAFYLQSKLSMGIDQTALRKLEIDHAPFLGFANSFFVFLGF